MLNAEAARIAWSAGPQNSSPSTLREFVALFCTKRRNKRRVWGWEVVGWQGVKDFEESAENCFGRILLPRRAGGRCGNGSPFWQVDGFAEPVGHDWCSLWR